MTMLRRIIEPRACRLAPRPALVLVALLAGCSGGSGGGGEGVTPPAGGLSGVVVGSYFRQARVCVDANANAACDPGEEAARTDGSGRFALAAKTGALVAEIGADASRIDADTGATSAVTAPIVLRAPAESTAVVSAHTTAIVAEMESGGLAYAAAAAKVAGLLGVTVTQLTGDFNRELDASAKTKLSTASADALRRIQLALGHAKPGEDRRHLLAGATGSLDRVQHVLVVYLENRSFDHLYGLFPGANGISNALSSTATYQQLDRDGVTVLPHLPPVWGAPAAWNFVGERPNAPFQLDQARGTTPAAELVAVTPDLIHRFYENQMQIHGGRNDQFVAWTNGGGLTMGYYDGSPMALWTLARQHVLADQFFQGAFGGSFLNHIWLACACAPPWPDPPAALMSKVDDTGTRLALSPVSPASALTGGPAFISDNVLTPVLTDGRAYAVNTAQPPYQPSGLAPAPGGDPRLASGQPLPPLTARTIGDTLTARGIDWRWYAGAWKRALADRSVIYGATGLQPHHQPFNYFARFDPTTASGQRERDAHLRDHTDLLDDIRNGRLPPVAFYKPQANLNQHAGYANIADGDAHVAELIATLQAGPQWNQLLVVVTYDEHGGWWDHVPPPAIDRWGPGTRVPALLISPLVKKGYVDSVPYDTTSILQFLTRRFGLEPLPGVRKELGDLSNSLDLLP